MKGYLEEPVDRTWHSLENEPYPSRFSDEFSRAFFGRAEILMQEYGAKAISRAAFEADSLLSNLS